MCGGELSAHTALVFLQEDPSADRAPLFRYVVDAADQEKFETAKKELQELMSKPPLAGIPLLVLANKNDLPEAVGVHDTIELLYAYLCLSFRLLFAS
jgi:signal recognition particle receptor subunit beta